MSLSTDWSPKRRKRKSALPDFLSGLWKAQAVSGGKIAQQSCVEQHPEPSAPHDPSHQLF